MQNNIRRLLTVCVGIDSYDDPNIASLKFACADAQSFYEGLRQTFSLHDIDAALLLNKDATLRNVRTAIGERLARISKPDDIVLLFFAGHGSPETSTELDDASRYLIMHDTQYDNIFASGLDLERDFMRLLERIRSRYIIAFIDACFSGRAGGRTFEGPRLEQLRRETRGAGVNLRELELGEGRLIISACDDNQVARENPKLGHGVFTFCLLQALKQKSIDKSTIPLFELYDNVAEQVARMTDGRQHPIFNGRGRSPRLPLFKPFPTEI